MSDRNGWLELVRADPAHSQLYIDRFRSMAEAGADLAGEARLIDATPPRGSRVLDAGCGQGRVGGHLAAAGHDVLGVDLDPVLVAAARRHHPAAQWLVGDLSELDLPAHGIAEGFDAIVCAGNVMTFVAVDTRREVLRRMRAHLRGAGRAVIGFGVGRGYGFDEFVADAGAAGRRRTRCWRRGICARSPRPRTSLWRSCVRRAAFPGCPPRSLTPSSRSSVRVIRWDVSATVSPRASAPPARPPAGLSHRVERFQGAAECGPRGDAELREEPVQMSADGPVRQEQPLADLLVGQPGRRERRDPPAPGRSAPPSHRPGSSPRRTPAARCGARSAHGRAPSRSRHSRAFRSCNRAAAVLRVRRSHSP